MLFIHKDSKKYLNLVDRYFDLEDPPEFPTIYLGEDKSKFAITNDVNGVTLCSMSAYSHVKKSLQVVEAKLKQ